jgi:hypothetical protein
VDEENRILQEIENVFAGTPDRAEAEKIVLEKWAPLMDEAIRKSGEALRSWLDAMGEANESEKRELNDAREDEDKE